MISTFQYLRGLGVTALLVAAMTACGKEEDSEVSVGVDERNLCSEVAEVLCNNIFICCTGAQIEGNFGLEITTTEDECRRDIELRCEESNAELLYSLEAGTVSLDTAKADACLKGIIVGDTCFVVSKEAMDLTMCAEMFTGLQGEGKDCPFGFECADKLYCAKDGKCHGLPGLGEKCPFGVCEEGLYCGPDAESNDMRCQALKKVGQDCGEGQACEPALYCDFDEESFEAECVSRKAAGEPCQSGNHCLSSECLPGLCDNGNECYTGSDCTGQCASSADSCNEDYDCGGLCELSGLPCDDAYDCDYLNAEECINEECLPGTCNGQPVCGEYHYVIDYCELSPLPMSGDDTTWE